MGEGRGDADKDVRPQNRLTIAEAATLLNVHPNTVRNRVRDGTYKAEKIVTGRGPTWILDRDGLITNTPTSASQQGEGLVGSRNLAVVQELLRPFVEDLGRVREELGAERVRREQAERERDDLAAQLAALEEPRDAPEGPAGEAWPEGPPWRPFTEQAEREREDLAAQLAALEEARDAPEEPAGEAWPEGPPRPPFTEEAQEGAERRERSWWRRWFGFE